MRLLDFLSKKGGESTGESKPVKLPPLKEGYNPPPPGPTPKPPPAPPPPPKR
ncbi:MAG: hypothetical protein P9X24_03875 [Candidatus Hatepunaea meridiana]|nr:hypothetical protein [Candidatus Hatepunaea meridiana]